MEVTIQAKHPQAISEGVKTVIIMYYKNREPEDAVLVTGKHRQNLTIRCVRYNIYFTGSLFGERFIKIAKIGGGN